MADLLVVSSKIKQYIKNKAQFNTSGETITLLSQLVEKELEGAIENAKNEGRKTVMARDFTRTT
jgi:histone H3/H4